MLGGDNGGHGNRSRRIGTHLGPRADVSGARAWSTAAIVLSVVACAGSPGAGSQRTGKGSPSNVAPEPLPVRASVADEPTQAVPQIDAIEMSRLQTSVCTWTAGTSANPHAVSLRLPRQASAFATLNEATSLRVSAREDEEGLFVEASTDTVVLYGWKAFAEVPFTYARPTEVWHGMAVGSRHPVRVTGVQPQTVTAVRLHSAVDLRVEGDWLAWWKSDAVGQRCDAVTLTPAEFEASAAFGDIAPLRLAYVAGRSASLKADRADSHAMGLVFGACDDREVKILQETATEARILLVNNEKEVAMQGWIPRRELSQTKPLRDGCPAPATPVASGTPETALGKRSGPPVGVWADRASPTSSLPRSDLDAEVTTADVALFVAAPPSPLPVRVGTVRAGAHVRRERAPDAEFRRMVGVTVFGITPSPNVRLLVRMRELSLQRAARRP